MPDYVLLIGFMGCGKTSVGKALAFRLGGVFLDTDELIEEEQGCTINEIFASRGEGAFRDMETDLLRSLIKKKEETKDAPCTVISVGGGLPVREENRKLMRELGTVIYLEADADTLYERLKNDTTRPMLQGGDRRERILSLMNAREALYIDAASLRVTVRSNGPGNMADIIKKSLENIDETR